jgi:hypothetical protein
VARRFGNIMKDLQKPEADINSDHNSLVAKSCMRLKENLHFPKRYTKVGSGEVTCSTRESARYSGRKTRCNRM